MPKKVLITLSLMGAALCNQDYMKTVFAEESRPSALLERSSVKIAITMENLNLRDKASTSGRILTTIPKGKTVTILSEKDENGWYKVSYDGKTGYVSRSYLTTSNSTPAVSKTGTATENLNLRDQPGTSGKILTTIPKGKTVTILSEKDENGWYKVSYGGKTGYVSGSYLTTSPSGSTTITTKTGTATENLNLRNQASLSGKILTTIPKGKTVTILSEKDENGWYKVSYDGKTGYAISNYIKEDDSNSEATESAPSKPTVSKTGTTTENLNLRNQASLSGKVLMTIPKGKTVTILSEKDENGWYKVSYDGKTGYAISNYIKEGDSNSESTESTPSTPVPIEGQPTEILNLRDQPSTSGKILTTIPKGKTVTILSEKNANGWYKVSYNGKTGYVSGSYFKVTKYEELEETVIWTGTVNTNESIVYKTADTSATTLTTYHAGQKVEVVKVQGDWVRIKYNDTYAWMLKKVVTQGNLPNSTILWDGEIGKDTKLYATKSTTSTVLNSLTKGTVVYVIEEDGDWLKIKHHDGYGYVQRVTVINLSIPTIPENILWTGKTTENLNVRNYPDVSGILLGTLTKGTIIEVVSEDSKGWLKIKYEHGYGYVNGSYVQKDDSQTPETPETTKQIAYVYNLDGGTLNVRPQPNTSQSAIGKLSEGEAVTIVGESGNWYEIEYNNSIAYVSKDYITFTPITPETPEITKQIAYVYNLDGGTLNVRPQPNTNQAAIGKLAEGEAVTIVGESGNWYEIEYNNSTGYVSKDYITFTPITPETPEITKQIAYVYNLDGGTLNVRPQPNTNQAAIGKLAEGEAVTIVGESGNWYEIEYNNSTGYVSKDYITFTPITPETPEITKQIAYVYNLDGGTLNVRPQPNTNQAAIGKLAEGEAVTIVGESGNWYEIEYNNSTGYVSKDYITFTPITPETPEITKQIAYVYNLDGGTLNVRPQPNTSQSAIGKLTEGEAVTIVGESGNWYEIEYNNSTGYVSKDYITFNKPNQHPDANIDFETTPRIGVVIDSVTSLNIRQEATTNSVILGTLTAKDEVSIIGRFNDFYKISYDDSYAYVHKDYVGVKATSNLNGRVSYLTTEYSYSLTKFAQIQQSYTSGTIQSITSYLNPNNPANVNYLLQYLRIDQFRSFDVAGLNKELQNKGVLHNQGQIFYNASRYYNIDPIFFVSQSIHETNWGTSNLAKGITITEIADENKPIKDSSGKIIDYERIQLDKPVTVYNLFGIGARDHAPRLLGTTYAYKKGWTTPEKAIFGAAEFISLNYINSPKYQQNTPFKIKYNQLSANQWHQYATTPWYAYEIGNYMHRFAYLYDDDQEFLLDIPVYK